MSGSKKTHFCDNTWPMLATSNIKWQGFILSNYSDFFYPSHSLFFVTPHLLGFLMRGLKKNGYITVRHTVRGVGVSHLGPDHKQMWNLIFLSLKFDSLTLKPHFISLWGVSNLHFTCPFTSTVSEISIHYESGLCYFRNIFHQKYIPPWEACAISEKNIHY